MSLNDPTPFKFNTTLVAPDTSGDVAASDDHYIVSWAIGKPYLVRVYLFGDGEVCMDPAGIFPYDGREGPAMDTKTAEAALDSAIWDGPCCPPFESRGRGNVAQRCQCSHYRLGCTRKAGCTAPPLPPRFKSPKRTPPVKTDATITTLRRLSRIVDTYTIGRNWTRVSESGVYQSAPPSPSHWCISVQAAPGRVRMTVGGPWMPVPKRHVSPDERKALRAAWAEGCCEEAKARDAAKEALRCTYGTNRWQRHLCAFATLMSNNDPAVAKVLTDFAKVVDCELAMRHALCVAYRFDAVKDAASLDHHVQIALNWTAP